MRRVCLVVALLSSLTLALAFTQGVALGADDPKPPKTALLEDSAKLQNGLQGSYCWSDGSGGLCADYISRYPRAVGVKPGSLLNVRFLFARRPGDLGIISYKRVNKDDYPVGDGKNLRYTLEPVRSDGRIVAWDAYFRVNAPGRHYYLNVFADWPKGAGGYGDSSYSFHVRTRS